MLLVFNRLIAVNNSIILLKYFHPKQYYSFTKSVVLLSDIHSDAAFCLSKMQKLLSYHTANSRNPPHLQFFTKGHQ